MRNRRTVPADILVAGAVLLIAWATLAPRGPTEMDDSARRFCIWCGESRLTDAMANIALFVPLGFALLLRGLSMRRAIALCVLYTLAIETLQFFGLPGGRVASVSDVLTNSFGAVTGAVIARDWRRVVFPQPTNAEWFATMWTVLSVAIFVASGWAVSSPLVVAELGTIKPSWLPVAPGFGWFAGTVTRAVVNGVEIPHRGNGPVIVAESGLQAVEARVQIVGRDTRDGEVPILYLHPDTVPEPTFMLSQAGDGLSLRAASRGESVGMTPLTLVFRDAFRPAPVRADAIGERGQESPPAAGSAARSAGETTVEARATPALLEIVANGDSATLRRTATTGWALIQSLVPLSDARGEWLTGVWLVGLLFPMAFWGWCSGSRRLAMTAMAAIASAAAILATVPIFGISAPPFWQWAVCAAALAVGALAAQFTSSWRAGSFSQPQPQSPSSQPRLTE